MGIAFLPMPVGSFVAGPLAGWLAANYLRGGHPIRCGTCYRVSGWTHFYF